MRTLFLVPLTAVALAACPKQPDPTPVVDPVAEPMIEPSTERMVFMHVMLDRADRARKHLIGGDVAEARTRAKEMPVDHDVPWIPEGYRPFVEAAFAQVGALQSAEDLPTAADAVARLATSCGSCHEQAGVQDQVKRIVAPGPRTGDESRMARHQWAADWMWAGLITADPELYELGASLFLASELPELPEAVQGRPELEALTARVDSIAVRARAAQTPEERAARYGELVTTCAACHTAVGRGGPVPD